ncbi:Mu-like prophage protein gp36 [Porphyromonadaceae bacterium KH3CP3RA]|nr:Mu-like prophage protein gp36 [Porphyromonadaceae bacterium KH3CP3RA]
MSYVTIEEIKTHLYEEQVDVITSGDNTILQSAIDAAISEAKGYLRAFDIATEFSKTGDARNSLLIIFLKDIAVWHFVNICNVNTDLGLRMERYKRAIDWLKAVQKGDVVPDLEALPEDKQTGVILFNSNPKRDNHY